MKSLKYTNFLLTVIAICLVYQCVKFGAPPSAAQAGYRMRSMLRKNGRRMNEKRR